MLKIHDEIPWDEIKAADDRHFNRLDSWSSRFLDAWEDFFAFIFPVMATMILIVLLVTFAALGFTWIDDDMDMRDYR